MDPATTSPRAPRRAVLLATLLLLVAAVTLFGGEAWYWISTTPDDSPPDSQVSGPFEWIPELPGRVRVKRWGEDAGFRHGPFLGTDGEFTLRGRYDRGRQAGTWQLFEGEVLVREAWGWGVDGSREGTIELLGVPIELSRTSSRVASIEVVGLQSDDLIGAARLPWGAILVAPVVVESSIDNWGWEWPRVVVERDRVVLIPDPGIDRWFVVRSNGERCVVPATPAAAHLDDEALWRDALETMFPGEAESR